MQTSFREHAQVHTAFACGTITLVQEHRFKLLDDLGVSRLFVLAHDAPLEGEELERLCRSGHRVRVEYAPVPGIVVSSARDVHVLSAKDSQ